MPDRDALREALVAKRGFPTTHVGPDHGSTSWTPDPNGPYVGFEDAWDIVLAALAGSGPEAGLEALVARFREVCNTWHVGHGDFFLRDLALAATPTASPTATGERQ